MSIGEGQNMRTGDVDFSFFKKGDWLARWGTGPVLEFDRDCVITGMTVTGEGRVQIRTSEGDYEVERGLPVPPGAPFHIRLEEQDVRVTLAEELLAAYRAELA